MTRKLLTDRSSSPDRPLQRQRLACWRLLALAATVLLLLAPDVASALEPEGINVGGVRMHPGAFLESSYDSNVYYTDAGNEDEFAGEPVNAFTIRPGITFRALTPDPGVADWAADARVSWEQYLSDAADNASGIQAQVGTGVTLWPKGLVAVTPSIAYTRHQGPGDDFAQRRLSQHLIRPALGVELQPYEGRVLSQKLGYDANILFFDDFEELDRYDHRFTSATRWNFLPQTGLALLLEQHIITYPNSQRALLNDRNQAAAFLLENSDSTPFRAMAGLQGLLLKRLDFSAYLGYGWTGYEDGPNDHLLLARTEVGYRWLNNARVAVGYNRNFQDSTFGNYYTFHEGYVRFTGTFIDRIRGNIGGRVLAQEFAEIEDFVQRDDLIYEADVGASYFFIPGLDLGLSYLLRGDDTGFAVIIDGQRASSSYIKHVVALRLGYEY